MLELCLKSYYLHGVLMATGQQSTFVLQKAITESEVLNTEAPEVT